MEDERSRWSRVGADRAEETRKGEKAETVRKSKGVCMGETKGGGKK
jgi:hypothetical protein